MIRGYYTAASGLRTQEKKLNNIANNMANVNTTGYKREDLILGTFGEHVTSRMDNYYRKSTDPIGRGVYMQIVDEKFSDHTQGSFEMTTRPFDMAIQGEGYFVITNDAGEEFLTRDGQFSVDEEGYLILPGLGRVQGVEGGDIQIDLDELEIENLGRADILVDLRGRIYVLDEDGENQDIARLAIAVPDDYATMRKLENGLWTTEDYTVYNPENELAEDALELFQVRQYYLEKSNVNLSDEMTNMIASQRSLQSSSQIVKMYDELAGQINTLSRIQ